MIERMQLCTRAYSIRVGHDQSGESARLTDDIFDDACMS